LRLVLEEERDGVRRLRALLDPVLHAGRVEVNLRTAGIEGSNALDEAAAARAPLIGDDDSVKRGLRGASSGETDMDGHVVSLIGARKVGQAQSPVKPGLSRGRHFWSS